MMWIAAGNGLRGDVWDWLNLTGLEEGDAAMNSRGRQDLLITKAYICQRRPEPYYLLVYLYNNSCWSGKH